MGIYTTLIILRIDGIRAYSKEFFGVHNFSGSSPPLSLGAGALGVGPLESS